MKKLIGLTLLSSLSLLVSNAAFAETEEINLCETTLKSLESNGYAKNVSYTVDDVRSLLKRNHIEMPSDAKFDDMQLYILNYNCTMKDNIAYPQFTAMPTDTTLPGAVSIITWTVAPPKQEK